MLVYDKPSMLAPTLQANINISMGIMGNATKIITYYMFSFIALYVDVGYFLI